MDNQDNLFNKIKSAAENAESKDFSSMEKVWSRIDAKLDTKAEKKQNTNFKKIFIAASVLIIVSIGFQFFKSEKIVETPNNQIVTKEKVKSIPEDTLVKKNTLVSSEIENPSIKENAEEILKVQIDSPKADAISEVETLNKQIQVEDSKEKNDNLVSTNLDNEKSIKDKYESKSASAYYEGKREAKSYVEDKSIARFAKKLKQIVIVDGVVSKKSDADLKDDDNFETILELPNPIYYINGVLYTEEALFGPNPTSPYAPLKKQNIETTTVLNPEKAIKIYGEKGKNGVVIITTKDGKPIPKKEK